MARVTHHLDVCLPLPPVTFHDFTPVPGPVPPPLPGVAGATAFEIPVPAGWGPGIALDACKLTSTVFLGVHPMCLEGHDCGALIVHVQVAPAPANLSTIGHVVNSTRVAKFSSSTVKADGAAFACMNPIAWPPAPMSCCAEPANMPTGAALSNFVNTVEVGMTLGDAIAGWVDIAADVVVAAVTARLPDGPDAPASGPLATVASDVLGSALPMDRRSLQELGIKAGVSLASGAVRVALTGSGTVGAELTVGGPLLGMKVSLGAERKDGAWGAAGGAVVRGGPLAASVGPGGTTVASGDPFGLNRTTSTTDWSGKTTESSSSVNSDWGRSTVTSDSEGHQVVSRGEPITSLPGAL